MSIHINDLTLYLNNYLRVHEVADSGNALNGLQVDNFKSISRFAVSVDACLATITAAADIGADLLLVHHGLFWEGLQPLTGRHGLRVRSLFEAGLALYSAHIPLDLHPDVGNNATLANELGLKNRKWFGDYNGEQIGVFGDFPMSLDELVALVGKVTGGVPQILACGPKETSRVGIISGGAGDMIGQARDVGVDTFITGEGKHQSYFDAEEWGINVILAGHYATETVGVKALAAHLSDKFDLPWDFIDHPTGM